VLLPGIGGELLLRDLVHGLAVADLARLADAAGRDADVVAREELDHDVEVVVRLAAGKDHPGELRSRVVLDLDLAPDPDLETLQGRFGLAAVPLEHVGTIRSRCAHDRPPASRPIAACATSAAGARPRSARTATPAT